MQLRDVNGIPGRNLVVVLLGRSRNQNFFHRNLAGRDSGDFKPGEFIVVKKPASIEYWMGGANGLPVLDVKGPVISVDTAETLSLRDLPACPFQDGCERQHAFFFRRAIVEVCGFRVINIQCCGDACSGVQVNYWCSVIFHLYLASLCLFYRCMTTMESPRQSVLVFLPPRIVDPSLCCST